MVGRNGVFLPLEENGLVGRGNDTHVRVGIVIGDDIERRISSGHEGWKEGCRNGWINEYHRIALDIDCQKGMGNVRGQLSMDVLTDAISALVGSEVKKQDLVVDGLDGNIIFKEIVELGVGKDG
jgi:hypothetical protein